MIHFEDEMTFDIPIEKAWEYLNDKEMMAKCIPTLQSYKIIDDDHVEGIVKIQLGLIPVESRVALEVVERKPPFKVVGKGISYLGESISSLVKEVKPGAVNKDSVGIFTVQVELTKLAPQKTHVKAFVDVEAEGKLKRIYDSIMEKKVPVLRAEFVERVQSAVAERMGEESKNTHALPVASEHIQYSWFGKIINFLVRILNKILERGEQPTTPSL